MFPRVAAILCGVILSLDATAAMTVTTEARSIQPGELVVLTISTSVPVDAVHVHAFNQDLAPFKVTATSWQVLIGIDLDVAPGTYTVSISAEPSDRVGRTTHALIVRAKRFPTRRLTVDEGFVNPPAAVLPRIEAEAHELTDLWVSSAKARLWAGAFVLPVPQPANSAFGTRSVFNGQPRSPHGGADFPSPSGTPVHAPNAGRVVLAKDLYYTGNTVVIDHGLDLFSLFAHLSKVDVHEGDMVTTGEVIGAVGATGRVTGPHLHWAVRAHGARVDPLSLLALLGSH